MKFWWEGGAGVWVTGQGGVHLPQVEDRPSLHPCLLPSLSLHVLPCPSDDTLWEGSSQGDVRGTGENTSEREARTTPSLSAARSRLRAAKVSPPSVKLLVNGTPSAAPSRCPEKEPGLTSSSRGRLPRPTDGWLPVALGGSRPTGPRPGSETLLFTRSGTKPRSRARRASWGLLGGLSGL